MERDFYFLKGGGIKINREDKIKKIKELEKQIIDLKNRFPAHSLKPHMFQKLEELEEELEILQKEVKKEK